VNNYKCRWLKTHARQRSKRQPRPSPRLKMLVSWNLPRKDGVPPRRNIREIHGSTNWHSDKFSTKTTSKSHHTAWNISSLDSTTGGWGFDPSAIYVRFMGRPTGTATNFSQKRASKSHHTAWNISSLDSTKGGWGFDPSAMYLRFMGR